MAEAYLDDGIRERKRSLDAENLAGLRFSEFHAHCSRTNT